MQLQRLIEFIFLVWSVFMSYYWFILFPDPAFPAVLPVAIGLTLVFAYGWAMLKNRGAVKRIVLIVSVLFTVLFSFPAYGSAPECNCYRTSFADLLPNVIAIGMSVIVWFILPNPHRT